MMSKPALSPVALLLWMTLLSCSSQRQLYKSRLVWKDEFNQPSFFDTSRWTKIPRGKSDWNRHMSDDDSCYAMREGKLVLRGVQNKNLQQDTVKYLTGGVYTRNKMAFGFGRLEIRAKLNGARGAWPAFWMLSQSRQWPQGGEIDIMERLNFDSIVYQTIHTDYTLKLKIKDNPVSGTTAVINPKEFNTYALEKYPDSLVFYINNKKTFSYPRIKTEKEDQFPFADDKHYLLIDMQLGGSWVGAVEPRDLPVEMEIDWVRFYEFTKRN